MGKPKPLMTFNGETCLSLVLKACLGSKAEETILVVGAEADKVRAEAMARVGNEPAGRVRIVENEGYARGQTSTLKTGLEAISPRSDDFILFPVDHPLVSSEEIDALIDRFEQHPRGRTIFIAAHEGRRGHPVLFFGSHRAPILALGDDEPLHNYIKVREGEAEQVAMQSVGVVSGMNTPEEYRRLLEIYHAAARRRPPA